MFQIQTIIVGLPSARIRLGLHHRPNALLLGGFSTSSPDRWTNLVPHGQACAESYFIPSMLQDTSKASCLCMGSQGTADSFGDPERPRNPTQSNIIQKLLGNTCPFPLKLHLWFYSPQSCPKCKHLLINQRDPQPNSFTSSLPFPWQTLSCQSH